MQISDILGLRSYAEWFFFAVPRNYLRLYVSFDQHSI